MAEGDGLTTKQRDVLRLHNEGKSPTEIATELGISSQGVHGHFRRLRSKGLMGEGGPPRGSAARNERSVIRPSSPAEALELVRQAALAQYAGLVDRKAEIQTEIEALNVEDREIDAALIELDKYTEATT